MSHIPNSAMPHAGPTQESNSSQESGAEERSGSSLSRRAGKIADKAREHPKTAVAAGAAIVAGAVAAAAIPMVRARKNSGGKTGSKASTQKKKS